MDGKELCTRVDAAMRPVRSGCDAVWEATGEVERSLRDATG